MKTRGWTLFVAVLFLCVGLSVPASSQNRDADTSRMQARQVEVGSVHTDRLSAPDDVVDWRIVRLDERGTLRLELTVQTSERSAKLALTNATGEELETVEAGSESATIERRLDAGIYYISVSSSQSLEYRLAIE